MPSVYDAALVSTIASTQPLQVDNQGNRVPFRGAVRSNQVGGVEDALSDFDAQYSSLFGYNTTDRPRNVGLGNQFNPQLFQAIDANYQSAISKRMATGGVVTARATTVYSYNNVAVNGPGRAVPTDYTQALEMQLTHPLMRGRGTLINRIPVVLARINEDIALHDFEANVRNLVKATEDAYWDLYCGYRIVESSQQSLDTPHSSGVLPLNVHELVVHRKPKPKLAVCSVPSKTKSSPPSMVRTYQAASIHVVCMVANKFCVRRLVGHHRMDV